MTSALTWLMEFAVQEARPVPRDDTRNRTGSKVTGAMAKPAAAVVTTRAATNRHTRQNSERDAVDAYSEIHTLKYRDCRNMI